MGWMGTYTVDGYLSIPGRFTPIIHLDGAMAPLFLVQVRNLLHMSVFAPSRDPRSGEFRLILICRSWILYYFDRFSALFLVLQNSSISVSISLISMD